MAQTYTRPLALERMARGLCPECGRLPEDHGGLGNPVCSLRDGGVADRIAQFREDAAFSQRPELGAVADPGHPSWCGCQRVCGGGPVRISRPCYDKYHRCPGWAGGGMFYPRRNRCLDVGYIMVNYERRLWKWRVHRCNKCNVIVLPWMIRKIDFTVAARRAYTRLIRVLS